MGMPPVVGGAPEGRRPRPAGAIRRPPPVHSPRQRRTGRRARAGWGGRAGDGPSDVRAQRRGSDRLFDHHRHERQLGRPGLTGHLPAACCREDDAARLKPRDAVPVGDVGSQRRSGGVQSATRDPQVPTDVSPPAELHPHRAVRVDEPRSGLDHTGWPEASHPEPPVAGGVVRAEQRSLGHAWRRNPRSWECHRATRGR